jgi:glycosyltransferase involved in cell wall biosynthesis
MTEEPIYAPITVTHIISGDLWAGAEVQVYNLCKALNASKEIAVTAVIFNPGILHDKLMELGLPVTLADEANTGALAIAKAIAAHCKAQGTDIVHTHGFKENVLGVLGKELARVRFSVRTVHGNPEHQISWKKPHKWLVNRLEIWMGRTRQQAVIAVSSQLERALEPLFPGKVHKIFNFVDHEEIQRQWLPLDAPSPGAIARIGIVGRLVPVKRVDIFIQTIALLNHWGVECTGVVIGDGPQRTELEELSNRLGISQNIEFKGFVDPALFEIRQVNILIMTSEHEGLPMTLLEALALKIPVVAHNVGGIPEVLDFGQSGILVDDHTEQGYASAVKSLLEEERKNPISEDLCSRLAPRFCSKENIFTYIFFYSELFKSKLGK